MTADINDIVAARVRDLRTSRGLTIERLSQVSGVSRSAISVIERAETSPTAVVLDKLANGLGVHLGALFEPPSPDPSPVSRSADQVIWRDPGSGYSRRNVSPPGVQSPVRLSEIQLPPGAHIAYENATPHASAHQLIWLLDGNISVSVGEDTYELNAGDCLACVLDRPTSFRNHETATPARYAVIVVSGTYSGRKA